MNHYRRPWHEGRGDAYDNWGAATYFFETDDDGAVLRQIETYANGNVLRYSDDHRVDEYGQLAEHPLDLVDFEPFRVAETDFTAAWPAGKASGPDIANASPRG